MDKETRYAVVDSTNRTLGDVQDYLPRNYTAYEGVAGIIIQGVDDHGWTLDGYVIPRLSSGLTAAHEITEDELGMLARKGLMS